MKKSSLGKMKIFAVMAIVGVIGFLLVGSGIFIKSGQGAAGLNFANEFNLALNNVVQSYLIHCNTDNILYYIDDSAHATKHIVSETTGHKIIPYNGLVG